MLEDDYQKQKYLSKFIRDKVLGDSFNFDSLTALRDYIRFNSNEDNGGDNGAFCDYYQLGNWFWEAMEACDFDTNSFLNGVEQELEAASREAFQDYVDLRDEYLAIIGAR